MTTSSRIDPGRFDVLRAEFDDRMITPDDVSFDEARTVFMGGDDRRPAVIVRPKDASEVARVITFARQSGLELAVRSGGHSLARHSVTEGGIVLDLCEMHALDIDVEGRTAWAQTGLTAGVYTNAVAVHGLATGFGDTDAVGIGGITLGGGIGYLARKHGLTIDHLLGAEIVTADAQILYVDDESHPDLFWAIRGGGGNFGVVTRLRLRLHEVSTVVGGMLMLPATPDVVASFVAEAEAAPDELTTMADIMLAPPMPFVPAEHHGRPVMMVRLCYAGATEAGQRAVDRLRALATPIADMVQPMPYAEIYESAEGYEGSLMALRTTFIDEVDRDVAETILDHLHTSTASMASVELRVLGGAVAGVRDEDTAFAHRGRRILATPAAMYERDEDRSEHEAWVADVASELGGHGAYVNFLGAEGAARVREAYPGPTWQRLSEVKQRYDPTNLFRLNQNVPPMTEPS